METTQAEAKKPEPARDPVIEEMMASGLHFGHKTSKTHPKMRPYIGGMRNTVHLFDLEKTKEKLQEALDALAALVKEGKLVLLVGTKVQVKELVKEAAKECQLPFVAERWIAGTITNFDTIKKRVEELQALDQGETSGEFAKYTKKEHLELERQRKDMELKYGGLKSLSKLPDAVFVFSADENALAIREAKRKGITVFAICDTNIDPSIVDYVVPANDDAASSLKYLVNRVKETILQAKAEIPAPSTEEPSNGNN